MGTMRLIAVHITWLLVGEASQTDIDIDIELVCVSSDKQLPESCRAVNCFIMEVKQSLAEPPLNLHCRFAKNRLTLSVS